MGGMYDRMKEKGIRATSSKKSNRIIKAISKADSKELFRQLDPIFAQNRREYNAGLEAIEKDGSYYKGVQIPIVNPIDTKIKKLVKSHKKTINTIR